MAAAPAVKSNIWFRWPHLDITLQVHLLEELNPELATSLLKSLPLLSVQSHAIVAGQQIYFPTRMMLAEPESALSEPMNEQPLGRINFEPYFQYISLNYGPVSEAVPAWPLGQVAASDIHKLEILGRRVWDSFMTHSTELLVVVERSDSPATELSGIKTKPYRSAMEISGTMSWQDVLEKIEAELDEIWLREPEDVRALRLGVQTSDAGLDEQFFSPWVMVTGLVRSLAIVELATLQRLSKSTRFDLAQLKEILHEILALQIGVIGYFGLPQLNNVLKAVDQTIDQVEAKGDFQAFIVSLFSYVNRYNLWLYHTFPWYLGKLFPKPIADDARSIMDLMSLPPYLFRSRVKE